MSTSSSSKPADDAVADQNSVPSTSTTPAIPSVPPAHKHFLGLTQSGGWCFSAEHHPPKVICPVFSTKFSIVPCPLPLLNAPFFFHYVLANRPNSIVWGSHSQGLYSPETPVLFPAFSFVDELLRNSSNRTSMLQLLKEKVSERC